MENEIEIEIETEDNIKDNDLEYKTTNLHNHILDRPDTYIGETKIIGETETYIAEKNNNNEWKILSKNIKYSEGLFRIFNEVLSNAIDNTWRSEQKGVKTTKICVNINKETGETSIENDGLHIRVDEMNDKGKKQYLPYIIFGQLLSSSNYNDKEERKSAGRNGLGVKLTNIYSKKFEIEIIDPIRKLKYTQQWSNNMFEIKDPVIKSSSKKGMTKVTYTPDFKRFNMEKYDEDILSLYYKHVIDCAMITAKYGVNIYLNEERINCKNLQDYAKFYDIDEDDDEENDEEEIKEEKDEVSKKKPKKKRDNIFIETEDSSVLLIPNNSGVYSYISFVNGIYTSDGGIHVTKWEEALLRDVVNKMNEKVKEGERKYTIKDIKKYFRLFVVCDLINPSFSSQSKTKCTSPVPTIKKLEEKELKKIMKWKFVEELKNIQAINELASFNKETKKRKKVDKLEDALIAGTKKSNQAILIITEGDSAKALAVNACNKGLPDGRKGREYFGFYPITGKILNVRKKSLMKSKDNKVIKGIIQALGLDINLDYSEEINRKKLRYGSFVAFCDADSVTADTPLLLKDKNDNVVIKTIDDIDDASDFWIHYEETGKEYSNSSYSVWTEKGWTKIKHVMRHKVKKRMYRIVTHNGLVDVTEDHSLIDKNGIEITPKECDLDTELLHGFPYFGDKIEINNLNEKKYDELIKLCSKLDIQNATQYTVDEKKIQIKKEMDNLNNQLYKIKNLSNINPDEAYVMGLFWADGSCGIYKWDQTYKKKDRPRAYTTHRTSYSWAISNKDLNLLNKSKEILNKLYPEYDLKITDKSSNDGVYKLILNGGKKVESFIQNYRNLFYDKNKYKQVPPLILNANRKIRQNFYDGLYDGDGHHKDKTATQRISILGKIGTQGVYYLGKSLGYKVSIDCRTDKPNVFCVVLTKSHQCKIKHKIKKIIDLGETEQYVYDLETENHHFQAGIGQLIVHNTDGSHIVALLYNFFHSLFPSLLEIPNFFMIMRMPIQTITLKNKVYSFFSRHEAEEFISNNKGKMTIKYYKGLGTYSTKEGKLYFGDRTVYLELDEKGNTLIHKLFANKEEQFRKEWIEKYFHKNHDEEKEDIKKSSLPISKFLNNELILHSISNNIRTLPSIYDGLKESQRKVLYCIFKERKFYNSDEIKVASLASLPTSMTSYHYGEQNMNDTIIKMAQRFVGSYNLPLLYNSGQFGTRYKNGQDSAAGRYIYTKLEYFIQKLFRKEDEVLLTHKIDEGKEIEFEHYYPILPTILFNNPQGIGTGWSSNFPQYNPLDCVEWIKEWIQSVLLGKLPIKTIDENNNIFYNVPILTPWYKGFKGVINQESEHKFLTVGKYEFDKNDNLIITELPIGKSTEKFIQELNNLEEQDVIKKYVNKSKTNDDIYFHITLKKELEDDEVEKLFGLSSHISLTNMVAFDKNDKIHKYKDIEEVLDEWCNIRYEAYVKRKKIIEENLEKEKLIYENRIRFVEELHNKIIKIDIDTEDLLDQILEERKYMKVDNKYDYLTDIKLKSLCKNKLIKLKTEYQDLINNLNILKNKTPSNLWIEELDEFVKSYKEWLIIEEKRED